MDPLLPLNTGVVAGNFAYDKIDPKNEKIVSTLRKLGNPYVTDDMLYKCLGVFKQLLPQIDWNSGCFNNYLFMYELRKSTPKPFDDIEHYDVDVFKKNVDKTVLSMLFCAINLVRIHKVAEDSFNPTYVVYLGCLAQLICRNIKPGGGESQGSSFSFMLRCKALMDFVLKNAVFNAVVNYLFSIEGCPTESVVLLSEASSRAVNAQMDKATSVTKRCKLIRDISSSVVSPSSAIRSAFDHYSNSGVASVVAYTTLDSNDPFFNSKIEATPDSASVRVCNITRLPSVPHVNLYRSGLGLQGNDVTAVESRSTSKSELKFIESDLSPSCETLDSFFNLGEHNLESPFEGWDSDGVVGLRLSE